MKVQLSKIRLDGDTQPRAHTSGLLVEDYAEQMGAGAKFPPVVVFFDGKHYWLADGFHRYLAVKASGEESIACDVREGTQRDAILYSCGANTEHGSRRSDADKEHAVTKLLKDEKWRSRSSSWIADHAKVDNEYVDRLRKDLEREWRKKPPTSGGRKLGGSAPMLRKGKDGKLRPATRLPVSRSSPSPQSSTKESGKDNVVRLPSQSARKALDLLDHLSPEELAMVIDKATRLLSGRRTS